MIWFIFYIICFVGLFTYVGTEIVLAYINRKFQKLWDKEKSMRLKLNPNISNAKLCEQYVMFCKRNDCHVEF